MGNTKAAEVDCPTCNGAGELVGDQAVRGERVDLIERCPECEGDCTVRQECADCQRADRLDRYDDARCWLCWECKEQRENAPRRYVRPAPYFGGRHPEDEDRCEREEWRL